MKLKIKNKEEYIELDGIIKRIRSNKLLEIVKGEILNPPNHINGNFLFFSRPTAQVYLHNNKFSVSFLENKRCIQNVYVPYTSRIHRLG